MVKREMRCANEKGGQNKVREKEKAVMESMGDDRSNRCKILCCPLTRKCESTMRVGIYRTGAGVITACEGEVAKETM